MATTFLIWQVRQASMEWSTLFGLGVRVGIMVCLLAWLLWDLLIDTAVLSEQADLGDLFLMISAIYFL